MIAKSQTVSTSQLSVHLPNMSGFEGFIEDKITVRSDVLNGNIDIYCRKAGAGPALLLLHGFPQTH